MDSMISRIRRNKAQAIVEPQASTTIDKSYEQYKTYNLQEVYKDLYPLESSTPEERQLLMMKRMEVSKSKSAHGLAVMKRSFTAANEQAVQDREAAGIVSHDWAHDEPDWNPKRC